LVSYKKAEKLKGIKLGFCDTGTLKMQLVENCNLAEMLTPARFFPVRRYPTVVGTYFTE
jgi:hypothetical protein